MTNSALDLITLGSKSDLPGTSRIHRHNFAAKVASCPLPPDKLRKPILEQVVAASSCLLVNMPFAQTRDLALLSRKAGTLTAVVPRDGGGIGLLEADLMFGTVEQARHWLYASTTESPAALLAELRRVCPKVRAIVLVQSSGSALVAVNGQQATITVRMPALALQTRVVDIAEVATHALSGLESEPTMDQIRLALEFALEAAASPGGLENFPILRQRYAEIRTQLDRAQRHQDTAA